MSVPLKASQTTLLAELIAALGSDVFCPQLLNFLRACVPFDAGIMLAYPDDALLVLKDELHISDRAGFDGPYRNGMYLLSPIYTAAHVGKRGCYHYPDITPQDFTDSEFFDIYYSKNDTLDQMVYLLESNAGTSIAISIERTSAMKKFTAAEKATLSGLWQLTANIVQQHSWPEASNLARAPHPDMHAHVQEVLGLFGSSVLTPRERDVVKLILRGYPSKSVARELEISAQTEQVHRKNIYQKLTISSHSELFTLFFDAITLPPADTDPLLILSAR
jgi:DNA-binding CsgD family transcriptional regulator